MNKNDLKARIFLAAVATTTTATGLYALLAPMHEGN